MSDLSDKLVEPHGEVPRLPLTRGRSHTSVYSDDDDEGSVRSGLDGDDMTLTAHGKDTARQAARAAAALGITGTLAEILRHAALLHDIGKADLRFQRSLDDTWGLGDEPKAKSDLPRSVWADYRNRAGWPRGGRHEELSRRLVEEWLTQTAVYGPEHGDLLQHLVVSHHGRGRPLVPPVDDRTRGETLPHTVEGVDVSACPGLDVCDWQQPARFALLNRLYGPWGLALLETVVRQADHIASKVLDVR